MSYMLQSCDSSAAFSVIQSAMLYRLPSLPALQAATMAAIWSSVVCDKRTSSRLLRLPLWGVMIRLGISCLPRRVPDPAGEMRYVDVWPPAGEIEQNKPSAIQIWHNVLDFLVRVWRKASAVAFTHVAPAANRIVGVFWVIARVIFFKSAFCALRVFGNCHRNLRDKAPAFRHGVVYCPSKGEIIARHFVGQSTIRILRTTNSRSRSCATGHFGR